MMSRPPVVPMVKVRVGKRNRGRTFAGVSMAVLGVAIVLVELLRKWLGFDPTGPHVEPVSIGFAFSIYGSYLLWPKPTKASVTFIVDQGTRIVRAVRTGRRSGDFAAITDDGKVHAPIVVPIATALPPTHPGVEDVDLPPPNGKAGR